MTPGLYLLQRLSAAVMVPLLLLHLVGMIWAIQGGLSAEEILGRTRGNLYIAVVYGLMVLAASVHAALGVRTVVLEWADWSVRVVDRLAIIFGLFLMVLGARAIVAVVT